MSPPLLTKGGARINKNNNNNKKLKFLVVALKTLFTLTFNRKVQNTAACILTKTNNRFQITTIFFSLYWLTIKHSIDFKIILITFIAQHTLFPLLITGETKCNYNY